MFNKRLLGIVGASWSCTGQEDELIDLSDFSPTPFPAILWLSAGSYRARSGHAVAAGENSPVALAFPDCGGLATKSCTETLGSRGGYCEKAERKSPKLYLVKLLCG